jgi:hypothetical protein
MPTDRILVVAVHTLGNGRIGEILRSSGACKIAFTLAGDGKPAEVERG